MNKNHPRKHYGIYLCPAPNLQGVHQIMDLWTRKFYTRPKLFDIPITDVVINSVKTITEEQGFNSLKIYN